MKGVLGGALVGIVAVFAVLTALAVATPPAQQATAPQTAALSPPDETPDQVPAPPPAAPVEQKPAATPVGEIEVPPGSEFNRPPPDEAAKVSDAGDPARPIAGAQVPAPSAGEAGALPQTVTAPAETPQTGAAPDGMTAPGEGQLAIAMPEGSDAPVAGGTAPEPSQPVSEARPEAAEPPQELRLTTPETKVPTAEPAPDTPAAEAEAPGTGLAQAVTPPAPAGDAPAADTPATPQPAPQADVATTAPEPAPQPSVETVRVDDTPPVIRLPVGDTEPSMPGVRVNRLPTVGGSATAPEAAAAEPEPEPAELGALARYAAPFTAPGDKPLMSVIIIDNVDGGLDRATLSTFGFPVTFAVDPTRPDAVQAMKEYRAAGFEVVLLASGLPAGATAKDLEVTLSAYLGQMSETVAILDAEGDGFQANRPLVRQAVSLVKETGHGLLTYDKGLNSADQITSAAGIPAGKVYRVLDADKESAPVIRRYLDRAVFRAAQEGQVILVGHNNPATVTALFSWALEGQGADVTLAPVSAILRRN